jgi:hypothetical protein
MARWTRSRTTTIDHGRRKMLGYTDLSILLGKGDAQCNELRLRRSQAGNTSLSVGGTNARHFFFENNESILRDGVVRVGIELGGGEKRLEECWMRVGKKFV